MFFGLCFALLAVDFGRAGLQGSAVEVQGQVDFGLVGVSVYCCCSHSWLGLGVHRVFSGLVGEILVCVTMLGILFCYRN